MIEVTVNSVQLSLISSHRGVLLLLKQKGEERYLPIFIGQCEADAIAWKMNAVPFPRPMTHDLLESIIATLGATVSHIYVSDLSNSTFYARIILETADKGILELDSRPSDAIALAVRVGVPIFAAEEVMRQASVVPSPPIESRLTSVSHPPEADELGAFADFIDSLDVDDLEPGRIDESDEG